MRTLSSHMPSFDHHTPVSTALTACRGIFRRQLFDVLAGHPQVSFMGVELPCRREVEDPLRILRLLLRPFVLLGRCELEGVLQNSLLYGQELLPPEPLRRDPPAEVLALHDDVARGLREGGAGLDVILDEAVAALPPGVPDRAPSRVDRVQLVLPRSVNRTVAYPRAVGVGTAGRPEGVIELRCPDVDAQGVPDQDPDLPGSAR
ncbi:hypothetical protein [Streptomyces sp. NPDC015680]|uniref:hypothetical protein n=1 Tax=Streptomyces sp. NPDC015680 TaxID=3364962 RepID=UPI0036FFA189